MCDFVKPPHKKVGNKASFSLVFSSASEIDFLSRHLAPRTKEREKTHKKDKGRERMGRERRKREIKRFPAKLRQKNQSPNTRSWNRMQNALFFFGGGGITSNARILLAVKKDFPSGPRQFNPEDVFLRQKHFA